jgi:hypothetical protein
MALARREAADSTDGRQGEATTPTSVLRKS